LFLQTVGGSLTGLAPADPNPTQITGKLGFSYGALVTADLTGSVQLGADNAVDDINGAVAVSIANGVATGSAQINDDLRKGTFGLTSLSLQAFKNTLSFRGALTGSDDGVLTGYGTGTLTLPSWASGASVSGTVQAYLSSAADTSKSYFAAWTQLNSFFGISSSIGVRYNLDGSTQLLNDGNLPVIPAPMAQIRSLIAVASSTSQSFTVKAGSPYILLSSSWAKAAATVPFQITSPNGTVYTEANLGNGVIALVPTLSGSTAKTIAINAPAAGTWQLTLPSITTLGTVTLQGFAPTPGSSVKITSPAAEVSSSAVTISYAATDSNPGAAVNLFFGTAASGLQGTLIASGLPVGTQSYAWSTKSLPVGTYHVYAIVTDTMSIPSTVYAAGTARIWPKLVFAVQPDPASVGNAINPPVVVDIEDADGEVLTTDNSSVTMRAKTGNDTLNVTVQAKNGVATFSNDLVLHKVASYTLIATDGSDVSVVSSTFVVSATAAASISGTVFDDANGDGVQDDGETGIAGITVYNDANNNGKLDPGELTTTTDVNGNYSFTGLTAGNYKIREVIPTGWKQITPSNNYGWTLTLSANQTLTGKNFGEEITTTPPPPTGGSISGSVFNDLNGNGILNTGETGLSGWTVFLDTNNDGILDNGELSTLTNTSGGYTFSNLPAGTYIIRAIRPSGWSQTTPTNNYGQHVTIVKGKNATNVLFGEKPIA
jgi:hypothetical protein